MNNKKERDCVVCIALNSLTTIVRNLHKKRNPLRRNYCLHLMDKKTRLETLKEYNWSVAEEILSPNPLPRASQVEQ